MRHALVCAMRAFALGGKKMVGKIESLAFGEVKPGFLFNLG
jgi:hypothetical protein